MDYSWNDAMTSTSASGPAASQFGESPGNDQIGDGIDHGGAVVCGVDVYPEGSLAVGGVDHVDNRGCHVCYVGVLGGQRGQALPAAVKRFPSSTNNTSPRRDLSIISHLVRRVPLGFRHRARGLSEHHGRAEVHACSVAVM